MNKMTEVKTFEEARKLSIDKWKNVLEEISFLENLMGEHCGFCLLGEYEVQQSAIGSKCTHCLVESKCEEYKETMQNTLCKLSIWVEENLLPWLDNIKENELTSRYSKIRDE